MGGTQESRRPLRPFGTFGSQGGDAALLSENSVLYRSGRWLVSQDFTSSSNNLSPTDFFCEAVDNVSKITAMCVSESRKYVAICEAAEVVPGSASAPPQIRILHSDAHKRLRVLSAAIDGEFVGCCFSSDAAEKHVLAYTAAPEHTVVVWQWQEELPLGLYRSRTPIHLARFNPATPRLLSICSPMRLLRLTDHGQYKEVEVLVLKQHGASVVDHCWLSAQRLAFVDAGAGCVRIVDETVLKQTLSLGVGGRSKDSQVESAAGHVVASSLNDTTDEGMPTAIAPLAAGFIVGCDGGAVHIYMLSRKRATMEEASGTDSSDGRAGPSAARTTSPLYVLVRIVRGPEGRVPVQAIRTSPEGTAALVIRQQGLCLLRLAEELAHGLEPESNPEEEGEGRGQHVMGSSTQLGSNLHNGAAVEHGGPGDQLPEPRARCLEGGHRYELLLSAAHTGRVLDLSCAVTRPLLVSCAADGTIRGWDTLSFACLFTECPPEAPLSVSLHPDGMQLAVAHDQRMCVHHVVGSDGLHPWRELPLSHCSLVRYAHGGQLLLTASGHSVHVLDTYTLSSIAVLTAHCGSITSLAWAADDSAFTTGGTDGMLYTWTTQGPVRAFASICAGSMDSCAKSVRAVDSCA